ncbi:acetyl-CoA carboxylase biotin carboxyl carrier protein [filamentous cyanobacterium LEGE 11480]|uniref:Biotin carboxyl carrier protein of acetyl-CoA carboxylase n=1 Tax=Romeriopsis navalis LEGE 11480 TaxID=2777977 RepID=A0A928Z5S6_9CYAN|nr:acetyl-CoA carboxylase biotin carboxyl carrier protein [Romeriopsis navalis]MBE9032297.1 acetyl-CoA carboxylase biotin carboxyl carrier protein [Romeriopsis navalis LEGE 11480]
MPLDAKDLREILLTLNDTDISEFTLKEGDFELAIRRGNHNATQVVVPAEMMQAAATPAAPAPTSNAPVTPSTSAPPKDDNYVEITSPIVGTFYSSPAPEEPPFVQVGDRVSNAQVVCIIEAMKIMNEIEAEVNGAIVEILVQNGQPVEFGQPLMRVNPA